MRIKLVKGISYAGAVKATKKNPYVECDEKTAKALISAGYFEEADETVKTKDKPVFETKSEPVFEEMAQDEPKDPKEMTLSQLKVYAKEINIDTKGLKTKADYLEAVTAKEEAEEMPWQW